MWFLSSPSRSRSNTSHRLSRSKSLLHWARSPSTSGPRRALHFSWGLMHAQRGLIYDPNLGHVRSVEPPGARIAFAGSNSVTPSLTIPFRPESEVTQELRRPTLDRTSGPAHSGRGLQTLPRPSRIVTKFEPHLRERTIVRLSQLFNNCGSR